MLVVHGGSVLDPLTDLAVRKSDVTTFRQAGAAAQKYLSLESGLRIPI